MRFIRSSSIIGAVGAAMMLLGTQTADAAGAYYMKLADGNHGPKTQNGAPGAEQAVSEYLSVGEDVYIVTVYMQAYDQPNNNNVYWQLACNSVKLSPTGVPEMVAEVQLTNNNGERPGNHPNVATDGKTITMVYGNNAANGNTRTYARVLDHMCEDLVPELRISENNNANEGAPDIAFNTVKEGTSYYTVSYLSQTNPDVNYVRQLQVDYDGNEPSLKNGFLKNVVSPCDIGRGNIASHGEYSMVCIPKGANRPPELGIECAYVSAMTGDIMWKQVVLQADPGNDIYYNQPRIRHVEGNTFAFYAIESNGAGKNTNNKGANKPSINFFTSVGPDGMTMGAPKQISADAHSSICSGMYGEEGKRMVSVLNAPITGIGLPSMRFVSYNAGLIKADPNDKWIINGYNGDGGHLQNLYGANPNTQGRAFQTCKADIPNPAYGIPGGFKADTETLYAFPHPARKNGEDKLSLYIAIVDGKTAVPIDIEPPTNDPEDHVVEEPTGEPGAGGAGGDAGALGGGGSDSSGNGGPVNFEQPSSSGGCSVSMPGANDFNGFAALALGLGLLGLARRREEV